MNDTRGMLLWKFSFLEEFLTLSQAIIQIDLGIVVTYYAFGVIR